jgi:hypothetical protein
MSWIRPASQLLSLLSFLGTIAPAVMYVYGMFNLDQTKFWTLVATVVWFAATPCWMDRPAEKSTEAKEPT